MTFDAYNRLVVERPELHLDPLNLLVPGEKDIVERITVEELEAFCTGQLLAGRAPGWMWILRYDSKNDVFFDEVDKTLDEKSRVGV